MINYYSVLGVSETASDQEIRAAYRRLLQESLMDQDRFNAIKEAYEAIGTPENRQAYDRDRMTPPGPGASTAPTQTSVTSAPPAPPPAQETVIMPKVSERTGTAPLRKAPSDATVAMLPTQCAICGHLNPPGETYCVECGFLLSSSAEKGAFLPSEDDLRSWPHLEDDEGQLYVLRPGTNTVGRENADIRIVDKTVSRHHATIVFHEDRGLFSVEDKGSTNGTGVNGQVLPSGVPHPIHSGDQVRFGSCMLTLVAPDSRPPEPTRIMGDDESDEEESEVEELNDAAADAGPSSALARLVLAQGFGPREIAIERGITSVGRLSDNILSLKHDRYVSGHHARIVAEGSVFRLLDVGSTNGTMLNGLRLTTNEAIAISEGDEITFGGTIYQFHILPGESSAEEAVPAQAPEEPAEKPAAQETA
ncbi:MAG TPA: FHA domain-containing protein [Capsulimonadaceae bacterium]|nr:FHA domain-containing protein [Capsulimonadaceae bacterium]